VRAFLITAGTILGVGLLTLLIYMGAYNGLVRPGHQESEPLRNDQKF
jgi:hypothetical protein